MPCPAGTFGPREGLQRARDCTICPAGRASSHVLVLQTSLTGRY